jgi:hypothetical protein
VISLGVEIGDREASALYREVTRVHLQDHPTQVLAALVERPGEIVTRDDGSNANAAVLRSIEIVQPHAFLQPPAWGNIYSSFKKRVALP